MRFESRWSADAVAAPIDGTYNQNSAGWREWIIWIASSVAALHSRMLRAREHRRLRAHWETMDDRMLKDIGIIRYDVEFGTDARHWR